MHQCGRCSSKVPCYCSGDESITRTAALCLSFYNHLQVSFNTITLQREITSVNNLWISQCSDDLPCLWRICYTRKTNGSEADVPHLPLLSPVLLGLPWVVIRLSEARIQSTEMFVDTMRHNYLLFTIHLLGNITSLLSEEHPKGSFRHFV